MVEHVIDRMQIDEIAQLWSRETGKPAGTYVRALRLFRQERLLPEYNLPPSPLVVGPQADMTREQLRAFCDENQIELPRFWFGAKVSKASAETQCRRWLAHQVRKDKHMPKKGYCALAMKEIEGLSERAFNRVWDATVPPAWKRAGRRT